MKFLPAVKRVVDFNVRVRVKSEGSGMDITNVKMSMNPFDEIAIAEAVRLKDKGIATEVIAVSCGVTQCQEILRGAMANGRRPRQSRRDSGGAAATRETHERESQVFKALETS
jgi:electron transfer flavoprotein beta subunit